MKKYLLISIALFVCCLQTEAQKYFHVFQDGLVIKKILFSDVDSISVTEQEPHAINMWSNGSVLQSFASEEVDSITVIDENGGPLSYMGIIGFNSELHSKNIGLLSNSTVSNHKSFVNSLPKNDGTILYYAVDSALYVLQNADIKTPLTTINFVTFTDGLDQGSLMKNPNYQTSDSYLDAIRRRIKDTKYGGLKMDAYSIGLRGKDVTDVDLFKRNLASLASSDQNAFEVSSISDLRTRLQEIANKIINVNYRQTISVKIPGADNGTIVRFTFDGKDAKNSQLYIQGTLDLSDYSLRNVTYHGIKARSGSIVQGTKDGIFIKFTFRGLHQADGQTVLPTKYIRQYNCSPTSTTWQINSEFKPENDTQRIVSYSGTLIMLVLDCSSSLGNDFSRMQTYANEFIKMIADNAMPFTLESPKNVQATMDDDELAINLSWDAVRGADSYKVYRSNSNSYYATYELVAENVTSCSWTDRSPIVGSNYYKVSTVGLGVTSEKSGASSVVSCSFDAPKNVKATLDDTEFAVNVSWDSVKYAEYYQVYRSPGINTSDYELIADNITSCSWKDESPKGSSIYYKVRAVRQEITSSLSGYSYVSCSLAAPKNVVCDMALNGDQLAVSLSWDAVSHAEGYQVYRKSSNGRYSSAELIADSVRSTSYLDVSPLSTNYYYIKAIGHGMSSSNSNTVSIQKAMPTPQNVVSELIMDGENLAISVSWDAVNIAEKYQVYRSTSSSYYASYELIADDVTTNSWIDKSATSGNYYYYKIRAIGHEMTSSDSNTSEGIDFSMPAPKNIKSEMILNDNTYVIKIDWDAVKIAEKYQVYRSNSYSYYANYELIADDVTTNSWVDNSPLIGYNYYRVRAVGHEMTSQNSNTSEGINFSLSTTPQNVNGELALSDNNFVINVTWDAVENVESYIVYRFGSYYGDYEKAAEGITTNSWTDNKPIVGYNYYKIQAVDRGLKSQLSNASDAVNCSLDIPQNVKGELALNGDNLAIKVTWDAVTYAESYEVWRGNDSWSSSFEKITENVTTNSWIDTNPIIDGYNYYLVVAVGHALRSGKSGMSNAVNLDLAAPAKVAGELIVNNNKLAINVSWDAVSIAEKYVVYRSNNSWYDNFEEVANNVSSNSWIDENPLSGGNYYKVQAVGHGLTSQQSSSSSGVSYYISAPTIRKCQKTLNEGQQGVDLSWDEVTVIEGYPAESYIVYRCNSYNGEYVKIADGITSTSWRDERPLDGTNYYKVAAYGYGVTGEMSYYTSTR